MINYATRLIAKKNVYCNAAKKSIIKQKNNNLHICIIFVEGIV